MENGEIYIVEEPLHTRPLVDTTNTQVPRLGLQFQLCLRNTLVVNDSCQRQTSLGLTLDIKYVICMLG